MSDQATSQNIKAGSFVLTGLALAIASVFILSNAWSSLTGGVTVNYTVTFPVSEGVGFLAPGSSVRIGGIKSGEVLAVQLEQHDDRVDQIAVRFDLDATIELCSNATVLVRSPLIGSTSTLDVVSVGWEGASRPDGAQGVAGTRLAGDDRFAGTVSGGMLGALLGPGGAESTSATLANLAFISGKLKEDGALLPWAIGDTNAAKVGESIANLDASLESARATLMSLEARWPLWASAVGNTLANLDLTGQQMSLMVQELRNSPWRLLYRPTADEARREMLYEASRNFVFGAADLRSALQSLDRLVKDHGDAAADMPAWALLKQNLEAASKRYTNAQQQLDAVLQQMAPAQQPK